MADWVVDFLFWKRANKTPLMFAFLLVLASKSKIMANKNNKFQCSNSTIIILLKIIITALQ